MKILVIETDKIVAFDFEIRLDLKGYEVRIVSTADEALKLIPVYKPNLILAATILGGEMDGI